MTVDTDTITTRSLRALAAGVTPAAPSQPGRAVARRRAASLPGRTRTT